jgi:hypothetical protein
MKKLAILMCLFLALSSCEKDTKTNVPEEGIIGTWYVTEKSTDNQWHSVKNTCEDGTFAEFRVDLVYKGFEGCEDRLSYTGTYVYTKDLVTCLVGSTTRTYKILELSGNNVTFDVNQGDQTMKLKAVRR